jgi:hypothetical protein
MHLIHPSLPSKEFLQQQPLASRPDATSDTPVKARSRQTGTHPLQRDRTTRGKLHLVKCERCRLDKQKVS